MGTMVTNVTNRCGKMPCKWNSKKRIITVILKSTYFDLKKKNKQPFSNNEIKYCHHMINMTPS